MEKDKIAQRLTNILPNRPTTPGMSMPSTSKLVEQTAEHIKTKQEAKELAKVRFREKQRLRNLEATQQKHQQLAEELGIDKDDIQSGQTENQIRKIAEQKKRVEAIEAIEAEVVEPLEITAVAERTRPGTSVSAAVNNALKLQGTSRPEVLKLLTSLNINLSVQLTKQDTANLLACLLTCNEAQLAALYNNKKIPIVIKTVIKRLQEDVKLGNIETIEKLWDRVFGKGQMQLNLPEQQQLQTGIIPNVPVSREAYIVIRDTLLK